jgi:hypothetical protein
VSNATEIPEWKIAKKEFTVPFDMKAGSYQLGKKSYPAQHEGMVVLMCL